MASCSFSSFFVSTTLTLTSLLAASACTGTSPPPAAPAIEASAAPAASSSPPATTSAAAPLAPAPMGSAAHDGSDRSHADVQALLLKFRDQFRACYDNARKKDATLQGTFVLDFVLAPNGTVKQASHNKTKSEIKDDGMGSCAVATLRGISFPPSQKGLETTISYPFGFKPNAAR